MRRPEDRLFILGGLGIVGIVALALTGHPTPNVLEIATLAAVTGGAGLAVPRGAQAGVSAPPTVTVEAPAVVSSTEGGNVRVSSPGDGQAGAAGTSSFAT